MRKNPDKRSQWKTSGLAIIEEVEEVIDLAMVIRTMDSVTIEEVIREEVVVMVATNVEN